MRASTGSGTKKLYTIVCSDSIHFLRNTLCKDAGVGNLAEDKMQYPKCMALALERLTSWSIFPII
jgi:hypothetical protein